MKKQRKKLAKKRIDNLDGGRLIWLKRCPVGGQAGGRRSNPSGGQLKKGMGRVLGTLVSACMLAMAVAGAGLLWPAEAFAAAGGCIDVSPQDWFYPQVTALMEKGVLSGYPDGTFKPDAVVTYGEFLAMAVKTAEARREGVRGAEQEAAGAEAAKGKSDLRPEDRPQAAESRGAEPPSSGTAEDREAVRQQESKPAAGAQADDKPQGHWALPYYQKGLEKGYFNKYDIRESALDAPIPRAYAAVVASGVCGKQRVENYDKIASSIYDVTAKTPYQYEIVQAYAQGILSGYANGSFKPYATLNRAEAASVILKLHEKVQSLPAGEASPDKKPTDEGGSPGKDHGACGPGGSGATADPEGIRNPDGTMKEAAAAVYLDKILESLRYYKEGDKYYFTVTFPEVPEGFRVFFMDSIQFKYDTNISLWGSTTKPIPLEEDVIQGTGTVTRHISCMKSLEQVDFAGAYFSIVNEKEEACCGYSIQYIDNGGTLMMIRGDSSNINIEYDVMRNYQWK